MSDSLGAAYLPFILVQFSEPISSTTLTTQTVMLLNSAGHQVPMSLYYDAQFYQAAVLPRLPLRPQDQYTVVLTRGITDLAGNALMDLQHSGVISDEALETLSAEADTQLAGDRGSAAG